MNHICKS